jgi:hypothetical protein
VSAERWLPIPGYEGRYEVSDLGRVMSYLPWHGTRSRILDGTLSYGYRVVALTGDGAIRLWRVHHLVLLAFVGPCPPGQEVRHGPEGKLDNRLTSICYGTRSENIADRARDGGQRYADVSGEKNPRAKLTQVTAAQIRQRAANGESKTALARIFGVGRSTICRVTSGECWPEGDHP